MAKLLLIDDDLSLVELLSEYLTIQGYKVYIAGDGDEGLRSFHENQPDLVILDVTMPRRDGWQTLERIRESAITPVIMLTSRIEEVNVVRGFRLGADDYVLKPFSFVELAARIHTKLHRMGNYDDKTQGAGIATVLDYGELVVDLAGKRVWRSGELVHLSPTEFRILTILAQRAGEVLLPEDLVRAVWGEQYLTNVDYVRRYISHLRKKLELDPSQPRYIHNEHGFGYRFAIASDAQIDSSI